MRGYVCGDCGHLFIYPKEVTGNVGFREHPRWETEYLCPNCKSGDIEEAELPDTDEFREQAAYEEERSYAEAMYEYYYGGY